MLSRDHRCALTQEEWNAAYFLGLESIFKRECKCNVPEQVLEGTRILATAGYRFRHFDPAPQQAIGGCLTASETLTRPCEEIANGTFDTVGRARGAALWLQAHVPRISREWLENLVATYDQLHPDGNPDQRE